MTVLIFATIALVGLTILMAETMYFNHKEKMEKIKLESNPLNKIFSGNKKDEESKDGRH